MIRRQHGVTLMELMVVVVIVGILAAIAYPSYRAQVRRSNRTEARVALEQTAGALEKCYTRYMVYDDTSTNCPASNQFDRWRRIQYTAGRSTGSPRAVAGSTFALTATPQGAQATDSQCMNFTLNETGVRGVSGSAERDSRSMLVTLLMTPRASPVSRADDALRHKLYRTASILYPPRSARAGSFYKQRAFEAKSAGTSHNSRGLRGVKFCRSGPFLSDPEEGERSHEENHLHHAEGRRRCPGPRRCQRLRLAEGGRRDQGDCRQGSAGRRSSEGRSGFCCQRRRSARSAADSAQSAANQALQAAQASQACCDATNEKIDRVFKKSVSK